MKLRLGRSVRNFLQLASANVGVRILGLFSLAFFTRYLSKDELVLLPVYDMLSALAPVVFSLGILPSVLRSLPGLIEHDPAQARGLIRTGNAITLAGSLLFAACVFLFAEPLAKAVFSKADYAYLLRITSLGYLAAALLNYTTYLQWANSDFAGISLVRVIAGIGRIVLGIGLLLLAGLRGLAWGLALNDALCFFVSLWFLRGTLKPGPTVGVSARGLIRESLPFYFESFLMYFRAQGDNWIVATMLGTEAMAVYFVARRIPQILMLVMDSVDKIVTTAVARRTGDIDEVKSYLWRLHEVLAHTIVPGIMLLIALMPAVIIVIAGREYESASIPCMVLCGVLLVQTTQLPFARGIFVTLPPLTRVLQTVVETAVLIGCLFLLSRPFAEMGVSVSRLLAAVAAWLYSFLTLRRSMRMGIPWRQYVLSLTASLLMAGVVVTLFTLRANLLLVPVYALAGVFVFLIAVSATNSRMFYQTVNTVLPLRISDPVRFVLGKR
jgi:O-antigen/teichoic acid export membrane protein